MNESEHGALKKIQGFASRAKMAHAGLETGRQACWNAEANLLRKALDLSRDALLAITGRITIGDQIVRAIKLGESSNLAVYVDQDGALIDDQGKAITEMDIARAGLIQDSLWTIADGLRAVALSPRLTRATKDAIARAERIRRIADLL